MIKSILFGLVMFLACSRLNATLVISVYNSNAVYLASDSLISKEGGTNIYASKKIFAVAPSCLVSIVGIFGKSFLYKDTLKPAFDILLPEKLETICRDQFLTPYSVGYKMTNVIAKFKKQYDICINLSQSTNEDLTQIYFVGYDDSRQSFFGALFAFSRTNRTPVLKSVFADDLTNNFSRFNYMGELSFGGSLMTQSERFANLNAGKTIEALREIQANVPFSDERMILTLLEVFRLHKAYAPERLIGEPYVIFKITKTSVVRIH